MNRKETDGSKHYIINYICLLYLSLFVYMRTLFRSIPGYTEKTSGLILWSMVILLSAYGILLTYGRRKTYLNIFTSILFPYEVYMAITFWNERRTLCAVSLCLSVALIDLHWILIFAQRIHRRSDKNRVLMHRTKRALLASRTILILCMMVFVLPTVLRTLLDRSAIFAGAEAESPFAAYECAIEGNIETICNLCQDRWETLSSDEKADTLQTVANIEASYLGLPHELHITVASLRRSVSGEYNDGTHTITLNKSGIDFGETSELLDTVCHEAYHAFQHRLCDAYLSVDPAYRSLQGLRDARSYLEEFRSYIYGKEDYAGYYNQVCESRAREYGSERVYEYFDKIESYLLESSSGSS